MFLILHLCGSVLIKMDIFINFLYKLVCINIIIEV